MHLGHEVFSDFVIILFDLSSNDHIQSNAYETCYGDWLTFWVAWESGASNHFPEPIRGLSLDGKPRSQKSTWPLLWLFMNTQTMNSEKSCAIKLYYIFVRWDNMVGQQHRKQQDNLKSSPVPEGTARTNKDDHSSDDDDSNTINNHTNNNHHDRNNCHHQQHQLHHHHHHHHHQHQILVIISSSPSSSLILSSYQPRPTPVATSWLLTDVRSEDCCMDQLEACFAKLAVTWWGEGGLSDHRTVASHCSIASSTPMKFFTRLGLQKRWKLLESCEHQGRPHFSMHSGASGCI